MSDLAVQNTAIDNAHTAMQSGDWSAARFWAQQAATQFPDREEPWLVLAAVSAPHASLGYLERAAKLHPASPRVAKAMHWTRQRLVRVSEPKVLPALSPSIMVQNDGQLELAVSSIPDTYPENKSPRTFPRRRLRFILPVAAILLCLGLAWLIWPGARSSAQAPGTQTGAVLPASAATRAANLASTAAANFVASVTPADDPSVMRSPTAGLALTLNPTAAPSSSSIATAFVTNTAVPTNTTAPTRTRAPAATSIRQPLVPTPASYVVQRGDTLASIAQKLGVDLASLVSANHITNPSLIKVGQKLTVPASGNNSNPVVNTKKHILVNVTEQRLYAYDGDTLVFDFDASTGKDGSIVRGYFTILNKRPLAWSDLKGFWMPDWLGFYSAGPYLEDGIHAEPENLNGEIVGGEPGAPASTGSVVLGGQDAHQLYIWADVGTSLLITK